MASTFTPLGVELQATGENCRNLGYKSKYKFTIIGANIRWLHLTINRWWCLQTTALSVSDGSTGAAFISQMLLGLQVQLQVNRIVAIPMRPFKHFIF